MDKLRTQIKMCGLRRPEDIRAVNGLKPEYIGFVFFPGSRRYITPEAARTLKEILDPGIEAVGVFVDENPETVAELLADRTIDMAQLHGHEDEQYLAHLRGLTGRPLIQAFRIRSADDAVRAQASSADWILLDAGAGDGRMFDWNWLRTVERPYFLAGGLTPENAGRAVKELKPYAVDVSSGIETGGFKDVQKMRAFIQAVRTEDEK